jgi:hypothetical protein
VVIAKALPGSDKLSPNTTKLEYGIASAVLAMNETISAVTAWKVLRVMVFSPLVRDFIMRAGT